MSNDAETQLVTKKKLTGNAKNLDYFDAIAFFSTGELDMDDSQKADLLSFVKQDGKGFIAMHTGGRCLRFASIRRILTSAMNSYQLSAVSYQLSAISYQHLADS